MVANRGVDGNGTVILSDLVEQIPLQSGASLGLGEGIHDVIAAGEDQIGPRFLAHRMGERSVRAFVGPQFWLNMKIGEVSNA
jgi:hypothetical protein